MNINKRLVSLIRIFLSLLLIFTITIYLGYKQKIYHSDESKTTKAFYDIESNTLDYVVIGSSSAMLGISPLEIYKDTNLKGYNLSLEGIISDVYCSMLDEVIERQKDATIVVDVDGFLQYNSQYEDKASSYFWISSMKPGMNFLRTAIEVDKSHLIEYLFPISKYHKNLTRKDYIKAVFHNDDYNYYSESKGFKNFPDKLYRFDEYNPKKISVYSIDTEEIVEIPEKSNFYLHRFLNTCKNKNVKKVIFVRFPKSGLTEMDYEKKLEKTKYSNYIKQEVESCGYKLIDYLTLGNPANLKASEFIDRSHLHIDGAIKFTHFFEHYLIEVVGVSGLPDADWDLRIKNLEDFYNMIR